MTDRRTPTDPLDRDTDADTSIHDTQTSFEAVSSKDPATNPSASADTLLSSPTPEDELHSEIVERLDGVEAKVTELEARIRLLEKQDPAAPSLLRWLIALLFFVALAVSWQLIATLR